jgi:ABC-type branched-subunit amino acid transport system substrate-binding protein
MQRHRANGLLPLALILCALAPVLAACGGDDDGSTSTSAAPASTAAASTGASTSAPKLSGPPVKTLTITSIETQGAAFPNIGITAKAYEKWINARGGIAGRPLQVIVCDEHGKPTDAAACGRQAVSEGVTAVVGSFSFLGTNYMPALEKAGIAYFGACCPITAPEWTSENSFNMGNLPLYSVGLVKRANEDGCQKINAVVIDGAQGFQPLMDNAMKAYGKKFGRVVILPATAKDYSPEVAEATDGGADCLIMIVSETQYTAWNGAYAASGAKARMYGPQGNLDTVSIKGIPPDVVDGSVIAGVYPDISTPPWDDYRKALDEADADPSQDYNSLGGMGTWAAYTGFSQVAEAIPGAPDAIDAKTFAAQAAKTTDLDTHGMVPPIDFTKEWTENPPYKRLFNRTVVYSTIKDGKVVPLTTEFEDVTDLAMGRKPAE